MEKKSYDEILRACMYDEENQIARDPLSSRVRGDVHELRKY